MKSQSGMTLLEVMVALVVFALAGLSVMQATLQQTRHLGTNGGENPRQLARG